MTPADKYRGAVVEVSSGGSAAQGDSHQASSTGPATGSSILPTGERTYHCGIGSCL
jgi:hypothetical protein